MKKKGKERNNEKARGQNSGGAGTRGVDPGAPARLSINSGDSTTHHDTSPGLWPAIRYMRQRAIVIKGSRCAEKGGIAICWYGEEKNINKRRGGRRPKCFIFRISRS